MCVEEANQRESANRKIGLRYVDEDKDSEGEQQSYFGHWSDFHSCLQAMTAIFFTMCAAATACAMYGLYKLPCTSRLWKYCVLRSYYHTC